MNNPQNHSTLALLGLLVACGGGATPLVDAVIDPVDAVSVPDSSPGFAGFATPLTLSTGANAFDAASADFNSDGIADLAVVHNFPVNTVAVLINTSPSVGGAPSFAPQVDLVSPDESSELAIADFNGDGRPDLAVIGVGASVHLNTTTTGATTASFAGPFPIDVPPNVFMNTVATADINGDGRVDLLLGTAFNNVDVFFNATPTGATTPTFAAPTSIPVDPGPRGLVAGDLNADGRPDVVVTADNSKLVHVFLNLTATNATTPLFSARADFATGDFPVEAALGDVDSDGRDDIAVANTTSGTISILLNVTSPNATTPVTIPGADLVVDSPRDVTFVDLDGDRRVDIAAAAGGNQFQVFSTTLGNEAFPTGLMPMSIRFADLNRDGKLDAFTADQGLTASDGSVTISIAL